MTRTASGGHEGILGEAAGLSIGAVLAALTVARRSAASQGAWRRARRDGAALQDSADRELERRVR